MAAAPDRFAMRVEQDDFQLTEAVALEQARDPQPQPLDAEGRGHLADESPRVGKTELHGHPAQPLEVGAIMRTLERFLDDTLASLKGLLSLEERRDLNAIFH